MLQDVPDRKRIRYEEAGKAGEKILGLIRDCQKYYRATDNSENWLKYLSFVDELVVRGLLRTLACSLSYLLDETDQTITQGILFEVIKSINLSFDQVF